jgi:teichuronic acid biosynthesis glycosyltransferase TuaC
MKVLFVSSGNAKDGISPIVKNQGQSLINQGIIVDFFTIKGKGFWSYFFHIFILRKYLRTNKFDIIHSHYSFTSYVAALAGAKPLVVSLMGSDVISNKFARLLILFFHKLFWDKIIVKSMDMYQCLGSKKIKIIPNGVNIDKINPLDKKNCQDKLGWNNEKRHILFAANPGRAEKNFSLARMSMESLQNDYEIVVHILKDVPHEDIPIYMNACDVLILSSLHEGSPNVVKEAMACNCPIVTTSVGDVKWVLGNTDGCFISSFDPSDYKEKIKLALEFSEKYGMTKSRDRIVKLGLDSVTIAKKIIDVYQKVLSA